jgi:hypothetical protein
VNPLEGRVWLGDPARVDAELGQREIRQVIVGIDSPPLRRNIVLIARVRPPR